jgi:hypothetical protein
MFNFFFVLIYSSLINMCLMYLITQKLIYVYIYTGIHLLATVNYVIKSSLLT